MNSLLLVCMLGMILSTFCDPFLFFPPAMLPVKPAGWAYTGIYLGLKISGEYYMTPVDNGDNKVIGYREYQTLENKLFSQTVYGTSYLNGSFPQALINGTHCENPFVENLNCTGWIFEKLEGLNYKYDNACSMVRLNSTITGNLTMSVLSQPGDPTTIMSSEFVALVPGGIAVTLDMTFVAPITSQMPDTDCTF